MQSAVPCVLCTRTGRPLYLCYLQYWKAVFAHNTSVQHLKSASAASLAKITPACLDVGRHAKAMQIGLKTNVPKWSGPSAGPYEQSTNMHRWIIAIICLLVEFDGEEELQVALY